MVSSVLLPEPDAPTMETKLPLSISKETSSRTRFSPKYLVTFKQDKTAILTPN